MLFPTSGFRSFVRCGMILISCIRRFEHKLYKKRYQRLLTIGQYSRNSQTLTSHWIFYSNDQCNMQTSLWRSSYSLISSRKTSFHKSCKIIFMNHYYLFWIMDGFTPWELMKVFQKYSHSFKNSLMNISIKFRGVSSRFNNFRLCLSNSS